MTEVVAGAFRSTGQKCTATSRLVVEDSVADDFLDRLVKQVAALKVGDPLDETTEMGPVISLEARDEIQQAVDAGAARPGVEILTGGRPYDDDRSTGAFLRSVALDLRDETDRRRAMELVRRADILFENFRPGTMETTVLVDVDPSMRVYREEISMGRPRPVPSWSASAARQNGSKALCRSVDGGTTPFRIHCGSRQKGGSSHPRPWPTAGTPESLRAPTSQLPRHTYPRRHPLEQSLPRPTNPVAVPGIGTDSGTVPGWASAMRGRPALPPVRP
ncbi:aldehyde dehydrogenase family protein [Streptomyces carpinensis]|uniref:Aldehyde dehydrogenase family protein n=1 Tax=Streptomyces carpinensis TaxID=66369 RepID=A0ABV1VX80_9ACTN|nr:aldehyde dehydrogenase family protein [Streptomyces carpinensis]